MKDVDASIKASEEIRSACLSFRSRRAARIITRAYDDALRPLGLQAPQLTLLSAIAAAGLKGQRVPVLVDVLAIDPTTISRNLKQLEKGGLAEVVSGPSDRRVRVVTLTGKGREILAAALPLWRAAHRQVEERLGAKMAMHLAEALDGVARLGRDCRAPRERCLPDRG
ncbi:MarR family winged helix-turn-helix transcriptional regulator [Sphingobium sp. 3R8]|uniref:MarR family winged helix-turn-helix transcriptional regulator n=1 Tax=Sphingobium sp. 3R8 TaxID=2874921 RepID=UPI001CCBE1C9|nr:MarR family winged helix-turn-helix transcriptional regulator [Sphingobium sp. 3R8]MBZ9650249.1 MarR family winged helix-turn-helix transcriptional regulator [Sphingobium sp. 3R8]